MVNPPPQAAVPVVPPVAPTGVATGMDQGSGIDARLAQHAQAYGLSLLPNNNQYENVSLFKPGMAVPTCFSGYTPSPMCKACPMKLDCMAIS